MRNIGIFWGIIGVILTIGSIMRFVVVEFYNIFIKGLSKRSHRRLVDETINLVKMLEEDHGIFAFGGSVSIMLHTIIMTSYDGFSFTGIMVIITFGAVLFMGLVYKYIYKDKGGKIKRYHVVFTILYILFLILHIRFN